MENNCSQFTLLYYIILKLENYINEHAMYLFYINHQKVINNS